jgi:hypothetical protein
MQWATHVSLQGGVDHLVLLNPVLASEGFGRDARGEVIAVTGQIDDNDLRIRESLLYEALDFWTFHCHRRRS